MKNDVSNLNKQQPNTTTGFTIVELLIVIVVIGILAAITIVAYSGIQDKARVAGALAHAAQIKRSANMADATGYWQFDECSGTTISDQSEKGNHGTVVGTAAWSTDTPTGSGCSFNFNGSTYINTSATIGASFYIKAAWVKTTSCGGSNNIISGSGSAFYSCTLRAGHNGAWSALTTPGTLGDGKWHFVVLEYDAGTLKIYRDGVMMVSTTGVAVPTPLTNQIGALVGGNNYTGLIDDPMIIAR